MESSPPKIVVALVADLFFSVRLGNQIKQAGFEPKIVKSAADFRSAMADSGVVLGVVDLGARVNLDDLQAPAGQSLPMIAFGPHKDVDALRGAKQAGFTRVMSNSQFHANTVEMLQRYARSSPEEPSTS